MFAYGTLCLPEIFAIVTGRRRHGANARLHGYRAVHLHAQAFPGLIRTRDACTSGLLYRHVSPAMLARIDAFEGDWYQRVAVAVETDAGCVVACTYVLSPHARRRATGAAWSLADFATHECLRFARYWRDRIRRQVPPT